MPGPWTFTGESVNVGATYGFVTLVDGSSFCLSGRSGDIWPDSPHGLFVLDVRMLSRLELTLDGRPVEPLTVSLTEPFAATFVGRSRPVLGRADSSLLVLRRRMLGGGLRENITIRNHSNEVAVLTVAVTIDSDFADVFAVKEGRARDHRGKPLPPNGGMLGFMADTAIGRRELHLEVDGAPAVSAGHASWHASIPPHGEWNTELRVTPWVDGIEFAPVQVDSPRDASPSTRLASWRSQAPQVRTDCFALDEAVSRALEDIGALRIFDPEHPDRAVIAAGAPWFMTLFGRDALLTAWMSLLIDPALARGVLETLADFQGKEVNDETEEQPGRILHEVRFGHSPGLTLGGGRAYYGTADATPLFVMLLGELRRWGLADDVVARLLPHADRALEWVTTYGDSDGDGYVEYLCPSAHGLVNQGWKDSWDGITFADGHLPEPPIALAEVQGYTYAAYLARAYFADEADDAEAAAGWRERATALRAAFNRDFWLPDRGYYALALDCEKRPVDSLASNMGHCLWTGIIDEEHAASVAAHLLAPEMFSGWGVRTLATSMAAYNPLSYHNGSVWPHDNALIVAGLVRYGFVPEAHRIVLGLLDAATEFDGRLPELFSGLGRDEVPTPVTYPTSCSPQAWASAAPLLFLRSLLRFEPWVPRGKLWLSPSLPPEIRELVVERVPLAGRRVQITIADGRTTIDPMPDGIDIVAEPRAPLTGSLT